MLKGIVSKGELVFVAEIEYGYDAEFRNKHCDILVNRRRQGADLRYLIFRSCCLAPRGYRLLCG